MIDLVADAQHLLASVHDAGIERGDCVGLALSPTGHPCVGVGIALPGGALALATAEVDGAVAAVSVLEREVGPRWVWWSNDTAGTLVTGGLRVARCWDLSAVHRLLHGEWRAEPSRVWARAWDRPLATIPHLGQLDLLDAGDDDGPDPEDPVRPDRHLRPEWAAGGWARTAARLARWAGVALDVEHRQRSQLAALDPPPALTVAHSESAAELLSTELSADGLPIDTGRAGELIGAVIGPRPRNAAAADEQRYRRDEAVLVHAPLGGDRDLRNPNHVRSLLRRVGVEVADTRAWRLEPLRATNAFVDALLIWRKAERVATTYGYGWLERHVGADGRLRGVWSGSDGAAGRMTAGAGLHNMPADMRDAVRAEPDHVFVRADLGQIEPRVLAAVSGDPALTRAADADDLYAPVAARLGVERGIAKVAVLAALYGQTSGTAGQALQGLDSAYPVAMHYLADAQAAGHSGHDVRTHGGRLVRMPAVDDTLDHDNDRRVAAARGRYARNAVVQGAAAELFKAWAVTVRARLAGTAAAIVLCLHDELLVHAPAGDGEAVARVVDTSLQEAARRWSPAGAAVRFVAETTVIRRWSQAKFAAEDVPTDGR